MRIVLSSPMALSQSLPDEASIEWLDEKQLLVLLEELPHRPMLAGRDGMQGNATRKSCASRSTPLLPQP